MPYRLVRVTFDDAVHLRTCWAVSDRETFPEDDYDWSAIPGARRPGEPVEETLQRGREWWLATGTAPDAGMYVVEGSPRMAEFGNLGPQYRHYILSGHDEYVEVIARGWSWETGQPVV